MILTHEAILLALEEKKIVIDPFHPDLVSINSVDIRIGPDLWHLKKQTYRDLYKPNDDDWEKVPPVLVQTIRREHPNFAEGVLNDDDLAFTLKSGEFYLATTLESVGSNLVDDDYSIVPEIKAKSTVGRQGLTVALCAGLGDVGYNKRWALEVRVTDDGDVPIAIGTPIAQVVFHLGTETSKEYNGVDRYKNDREVRFLPKPLKFIRSKDD